MSLDKEKKSELIYKTERLTDIENKIMVTKGETAAATAKSLQSCPTLCNPIDGSPPGSPIPGILKARTLEWVSISSSVHESKKWKWTGKVREEKISSLTLTDTNYYI